MSAVAVETDGRREVLGEAVGPSEAEPFWTDFLRSLMRRGLRGAKLVVSYPAHEVSSFARPVRCFFLAARDRPTNPARAWRRSAGRAKDPVRLFAVAA